MCYLLQRFKIKFRWWSVTIAILLLLALLLGLSALYLYNAMFNDITVQDSYIYNHNYATEPLRKSAYTPHYLISYADGNEIYYKNQTALATSAMNHGFDYIINYHKKLLAPQFLQDYNMILRRPSGAGFWLWKPWIILHTMEQAPENSVIYYFDSAFVINEDVLHFTDLLKADKDIIVMQDDQHEHYLKLEHIVNRETLVDLGCDTEECRNAPNVIGGFIVVRNTAKARAFIKTWFKYCQNEKWLTGADLDHDNQNPQFKRHLHDQALLGVTRYLHGENVLVYPKSKWKGVRLIRRRPGGRFVTRMPLMRSGRIANIENNLLNSYFVKFWRSWIYKKEFAA